MVGQLVRIRRLKRSSRSRQTSGDLPTRTSPEFWRIRLRKRRGSATIDYFLVVGVLLPLAAIVWWFGPRAIHAVYDMSTVVIGWPFM
jgi:hypothetical protein